MDSSSYEDEFRTIVLRSCDEVMCQGARAHLSRYLERSPFRKSTCSATRIHEPYAIDWMTSDPREDVLPEVFKDVSIESNS